MSICGAIIEMFSNFFTKEENMSIYERQRDYALYTGEKRTFSVPNKDDIDLIILDKNLPWII